MEATSSHMIHSAATAERSYRLQTRSCAQTTGRVVKSLLADNKKRKLPDPALPPAKRACSGSKGSSPPYEETGVWSREDFKVKKPKRIESFESRLNYHLKPKPLRRMQREDEFQNQLCDEHCVEYDAPVAEESALQRRNRRAINNQRIQESRKNHKNDRLSQSLSE